MNTQEWNLDDPKQAEEALHYFYSLPDDEWNSDAEVDPEDIQEFQALDKLETTSNLNESSNSERSNNSFACTDDRSYQLLENSNVAADKAVDQDNQDGCSLVIQEQHTAATEPTSDNSSSEEEELDEWAQESQYFDDLSVVFEDKASAVLSADNNGKEISYLQEILDDKILQFIVSQSNLFAQQENKKNWHPLTLEELKAYLGCLIIMGIHQLPRLENYWSSDPLLFVKCISDVMTSKRFKKITEILHCNDNSTNHPRDSPEYDKLHKIRPLISHLSDKCLTVYNCSSNLSVDESMIAFKGRISFKQYMPMKPVKRGYKVWCLADSQTGFISKFEVYTGKSKDNKKEYNLGEKVVWNLTKHMKNKKCLVAFDNFFTSLSLMKKLHRNDIFGVGTVRSNRKGLPCMMKQKDKLQRGEFMFESSGVVSAVKWQDSKPVTLLTTAVSPKDTTVVQRTQKDGSRATVYCPKVVDVYNKIMGGVDRFDQRKERYAIGRRSIKWWHRIFHFLIDLSIVNSFILFQLSKRNPRTSDQLAYRIALARQLINGYSSRKRRGQPVQFLANKRIVPEEVRLSQVGTHLPEKGTYRRCRMCSTKLHEKRTPYSCSHCKVPVCIPLCFRKLHQRSK